MMEISPPVSRRDDILNMNENQDRVRTLTAQIEQLQRQWPKHSVPPALMQQLDELEDELEEAKAKVQANDQGDSAATANSI